MEKRKSSKRIFVGEEIEQNLKNNHLNVQQIEILKNYINSCGSVFNDTLNANVDFELDLRCDHREHEDNSYSESQPYLYLSAKVNGKEVGYASFIPYEKSVGLIMIKVTDQDFLSKGVDLNILKEFEKIAAEGNMNYVEGWKSGDINLFKENGYSITVDYADHGKEIIEKQLPKVNENFLSSNKNVEGMDLPNLKEIGEDSEKE